MNVSPCPEAASVAPSAIVSETPTRKRPRIVKSEDDRTPLPNPFPLPKHYRSDVELALASGKMTFDTTAAFLSSIAAAMLVFKRYPTPDDYTCVGRSIIAKYPFFSSPAGTPYVNHKSVLCLVISAFPFLLGCYFRVTSKSI